MKGRKSVMDAFTNIAYKVFIGAAILLVVLILLTLFPIEGNYQLRVVESGSMEPAIRIGSIVVIKPQDRYVIGDVVTFGQRGNTPTTHRIVAESITEGELRYTTRGDANDVDDGRLIAPGEIIGKVLFSVPFVGYIVYAAQQPIGFFALIVVPMFYVIVSEMFKIVRIARGKQVDTPEET